MIIGIIFCVNHINKKLIKSNNMTISMDYSGHNFNSENEIKISKLLMEIKRINVLLI